MLGERPAELTGRGTIPQLTGWCDAEAVVLLSALVIPRGNMFQHRASDFSPSVAVIQKHLGVVEKELEKIGRMAGRQTSEAASAATDQIGDAISTILSEMVDRFRKGGQAAGDQAGRLGSQALDLGANYRSDALQRVASEAENRPLVT